MDHLPLIPSECRVVPRFSCVTHEYAAPRHRYCQLLDDNQNDLGTLAHGPQQTCRADPENRGATRVRYAATGLSRWPPLGKRVRLFVGAFDTLRGQQGQYVCLSSSTRDAANITVSALRKIQSDIRVILNKSSSQGRRREKS